MPELDARQAVIRHSELLALARRGSAADAARIARKWLDDFDRDGNNVDNSLKAGVVAMWVNALGIADSEAARSNARKVIERYLLAPGEGYAAAVAVAQRVLLHSLLSAGQEAEAREVAQQTWEALPTLVAREPQVAPQYVIAASDLLRHGCVDDAIAILGLVTSELRALRADPPPPAVESRSDNSLEAGLTTAQLWLLIASVYQGRARESLETAERLYDNAGPAVLHCGELLRQLVHDRYWFPAAAMVAAVQIDLLEHLGRHQDAAAAKRKYVAGFGAARDPTIARMVSKYRAQLPSP